MTPTRSDLRLYRGDTEPFRVVLWADTDLTVPYDLTGSTVAAEIHDKSAGTVVVDLEVVVTLPNTVDVVMRPDMYDTCPKKGVWDLQITTADGDVHTPVAGAVAVDPDVTDSLPMP